MAMNDQSFEEDALVDDLKEPLNVQDVQEPKSASSDLNAHVDALNKSLNVLDIQESEFASSDVNALESTSFDVNFLVDALNIQDDQESKSEKKDKLLSSWLELPPELLYQVSKHLSNIYFSIFCAVCKSWRSSAQSWHSNALVFRLRTLLDIPHSESPCNLMTLDTYQDFSPVLSVRLLCSKMGWLLLALYERFGYCRFFFFNPFTMVKIELPSHFYAFEIMSFSLPPTSKDCFVVGIESWGFGIIRRGEESWNIFDFKRSLPKDIFLSDNSPVLYKGRCYCLCMSGELGVFDLNEYLRNPEGQNSFRWIQIVPRGFSEELVDSIIQCYLVESNGQLYSVFEFEDFNPCFLVFSLNPNKSQLKWHAVENLRSQIFYVGVVGSISEPAVAEGVGNKIYLPNVQGNRCVFYNLKTKRCQSFYSDYSTNLSPHGKEHGNYVWIKCPLANSG
ncbi:F-box protein At4g00893-like [Quercus lobata]|uniref:F-box protein n=1 Tax=Quercus lobata TaxID=97700 RepID=A0A7N2M6F7_QUELO|nr:F-box protein At4g00893-like [Quercus lobata]